MRPPVTDYPTSEHLSDLIGHESGQCVSLWMQTHRSGRKTNQNPIRFKNLIREALEQSQDEKLTARLQGLAELEHDFEFWQHQSEGFALFICEEFERAFRLAHSVENGVAVDEHFHLLPIIGAACSGNQVNALALSWDRARFFTANQHVVSELHNEHFPTTFEELVTARDAEEQLQFTSHRARGQSAGASAVAMYHGHGEGEEKIEADRNAYLTRVAKRVAEIQYSTKRPLLLVATDEVAGHFRSNSDFEITEHIAASPDGLDETEFESRIRESAGHATQRSMSDLKERLGTAIARQLGSTEPSEIATAASRGRIETLLLSDSSKDVPSEVVNVAIRQTLSAGGEIVVDHEQSTLPIAAIYRY